MAVFLNTAMVYLASFAAGGLAREAGMPLPWMIGPILVSAALYLSGLARRKIPVWTRVPGQLIVATQVGLAFTPAALAALLGHAPLFLGMAALTILWALLSAMLLQKISGQGYTTAFLATVPTSPVEAALLAESLGRPTGIVVVAQTLRIAAVVILVPTAIYILEGWPAARALPVEPRPMDMALTLVLLLAGTLGGRLFRWLRIANPLFMGPLAASAALAACGAGLPSHPAPLLAAAQILLGSWLGSTFTRETFARAGRLTGAVVASGLSLLLLCSLGAVVVARLAGLDWELLLLGAAPGGITEMALTARFLGLDLTMVTAFHLTRVFLVVPMVPFLARWLHRRGRD